MLRTIGVFVVLFLTWLLLSGIYKPFLVTLGALSSALAAALYHRFYQGEGQAFSFSFILRALAYWPWLLWEIVKANIDVAKVILSPSLPITPTMIRLRASQKTDAARVLYANSITLTPGTVTVDIHDNVILVHALIREAAEGLAEGEMDRRAAALESSP